MRLVRVVSVIVVGVPLLPLEVDFNLGVLFSAESFDFLFERVELCVLRSQPLAYFPLVSYGVFKVGNIAFLP